jgi:gliding motility-associated-like protein
LFFLFFAFAKAQLGFCAGETGSVVFNEDFGTGTTNGPALPTTVTTYRYVNNSPNDGEYTITSLMQQPNTSFFNSPDRTPNDTNGRMLLVNADFNPGIFYQTPVNGLCENTPYEFSAWVINAFDSTTGVCAGNEVPIRVRFEIWDASDTNLLASGVMPPRQGETAPDWRQYGLTFTTSPGQNGCILKLINDAPGGCGNDLAIDDIQFRTCGDSVDVSDNTGQPELFFCVGESAAGSFLIATTSTSVFASPEYQWQSSIDNVNFTDIPGETAATFDLSGINSSQFFRVKIAEDAVNLNNSQCVNFSNAYSVSFISVAPPDVVNATITICPGDTATLEAVVVAGLIYNWYNAPNAGTLLAADSPTFQTDTPGFYFLEVEDPASGCINGRMQVEVILDDAPTQTDFTTQTCDGNPVVLDPNFTADSYLWSTNETTPTVTVSNVGTYTLDATSAAGCTYTFTFQVDPVGDAPPAQTEFEFAICDGEPVELDPMFTGVDYLWSTSEDTPTIIVDMIGNYEVEVTTTLGCVYTISFIVNEAETPVITGVDTDQQPIEILIEDSDGRFEFAFNDSGFQPSPFFFEEVLPRNIARVRNAGGCNTVEFEFLDLQIPQFFTPNGDGFNDFFQLPDVLNYPGYTIDIFDRNGKLLERLDDTNLSWDGTFNNQPLPSSDYWYIFNHDGVQIKGHFTLKR